MSQKDPDDPRVMPKKKGFRLLVDWYPYTSQSERVCLVALRCVALRCSRLAGTPVSHHHHTTTVVESYLSICLSVCLINIVWAVRRHLPRPPKTVVVCSPTRAIIISITITIMDSHRHRHCRSRRLFPRVVAITTRKLPTTTTRTITRKRQQQRLHQE